MSVGASSIKRAAKSAAKPEEKKGKAVADETGRPAKKTSEKAVKSEKQVAKKVAEKKPAGPEMYGIGDKLPIHLM